MTQFNAEAPELFKKTFSSITFFCEKKTQIEYELASLSYTDRSLVFTLNNGIRYSCDKISNIGKLLNDLNKLLSDDPEKIILVGFHDDQKLEIFDTYALSKDNFQKVMTQFNAEAPKAFEKTSISILWQNIASNQYIIGGGILSIVAILAGLWYNCQK